MEVVGDKKKRKDGAVGINEKRMLVERRSNSTGVGAEHEAEGNVFE